MKVNENTLVCEALALNREKIRIIEEENLGFLLCATCQLDSLKEISLRHGVELSKLIKLFND